jgi:UbiD family decarboxylase
LLVADLEAVIISNQYSYTTTVMTLHGRYAKALFSSQVPRPFIPTVQSFHSTMDAAAHRTTEGSVDAVEAQLDFRKFIDILREDGDLAEIDDEVDPHLEVGAIVRRVSEIRAKAPLFNNVRGARNGLWRIFGNAASLRSSERERFGRVARNLGLPRDASWKDISDRFIAWKKATPLPPNILPTGPCKENKMFGDEIDLEALPAPYLHEGDGGKYLQTYGIHVLQTPDRSWTNWSIFRGMVHDRNHLVCLVGGGQHNSIIRDLWLKEGRDEMPWALAMGVPPIASVVASMPVPEGVSESEYIGAVTGRPLDLVRCELNDLLVPANSEIILEGTMSFTRKGPEGPFGDYLALVFEDEQKLGPLFRVDAITYRDDAILPVSCPGQIVDESVRTSTRTPQRRPQTHKTSTQPPSSPRQNSFSSARHTACL